MLLHFLNKNYISFITACARSAEDLNSRAWYFDRYRQKEARMERDGKVCTKYIDTGI